MAREIAVPDGETAHLGEIRIEPWTSAPSIPLPAPKQDENLLATWVVRNPFEYDFPRQPITFPLPVGVSESTPMYIMTSYGPGRDDVPEAAQILDGELFLLISLPARSQLEVSLIKGLPKNAPSPLWWKDEGPSWLINTGCAAFRIAGNEGPRLPPVLGIRGADQCWRGEGRFSLPDGVKIVKGSTTLVNSGPVCCRFMVETVLSTGQIYRVEVTAMAGEPLLLVRETSTSLNGGAFEFSLKAFSGGRGYLHWMREKDNFHWSTLERKDAIKATLPEQVPWWIAPNGFGYAVTMDSLKSEDYIAFFSVRRGEWVDERFARLAQGPVNPDGTANGELDWPYPEMVGSSISSINVHTDTQGDVFFRFGMFDGERQWAILASRFSENDGERKAIATFQHAYATPRLRDFRLWNFDV